MEQPPPVSFTSHRAPPPLQDMSPLAPELMSHGQNQVVMEGLNAGLSIGTESVESISIVPGSGALVGDSKEIQNQV